MNILWLVQWYKYNPYQCTYPGSSGVLQTILSSFPAVAYWQSTHMDLRWTQCTIWTQKLERKNWVKPSAKVSHCPAQFHLTSLDTVNSQAHISFNMGQVLSKNKFNIFENDERCFNDIQIHAPPSCNFQSSDNEDFHQLTGNFIQNSTPNSYIITIWARWY